MDYQELEKKLLREGIVDLDINIASLKSLVPKENQGVLYEIYVRLRRDLKETGWAILISRLYSPQSEALRVIRDSTPKVQREQTFDSEFHRMLKRGYQKKIQHNIPHDPKLLQAELSSQNEYHGTKGKLGPEPNACTNYNRPGGRER